MRNDSPISVIESENSTAPLQLRLQGCVTVQTVKELHRVAGELAARNRDVVVCCRKVEYLDTAAIQVLLCLGRSLESRNHACELTGMAGQVRRDFQLVGLGRVLADDAPDQ